MVKHKDEFLGLGLLAGMIYDVGKGLERWLLVGELLHRNR